MTKKNFITLILSTIGGILFALGMCMTMLPEWNAFQQGIVVGCIGLMVLTTMILTRRKMEGKSIMVKLTPRTISVLFISILSVATFGLGMCLIMVWDNLILGIVLGIIGIGLLLCLVPIVKGLK